MSIEPLGQRDERWANLKLGFSSDTLGSKGCTITALAMLANHYGYTVTPADVNERLKAVNGFANKNLVIWSKVGEAFPRLKFIERGYQYDNDKVKKNLPCLVEVDGKRIGSSKHWVLYLGKQQMADPWFGNIKSTSFYPATGYSIIKGEKVVPEPVKIGYTEEEVATIKEESNKNFNLYESERNKNTELEREIERLRNELSNCNSDLRREVGAAKDREAEKDKRHSDFIASLADPLGTRQDEAEIIVEVKRLIDVEQGMEKARDGEATAKKELADYKLEVKNKLEGLRGVDSSMPRTLSGVFEALVRFWNKSRQGKVQLSPEASAWDKITSYLWKAR